MSGALFVLRMAWLHPTSLSERAGGVCAVYTEPRLLFVVSNVLVGINQSGRSFL